MNSFGGTIVGSCGTKSSVIAKYLIMTEDCRNRSYSDINLGFILHSLNNHQKTLVRQLRKLMKRQKQSKYGILFNETCIEEFIYIFMYYFLYLPHLMNTHILYLLIREGQVQSGNRTPGFFAPYFYTTQFLPRFV